MKKIIAMVLAVVVFAAGFGAGNIYRSICKAAESKSGAVSENGTEVLDQTEQNSDSNGMAEPESETQSETVAVGLESTLLSEKVYRNSTGTRLTDFEIMEQYPDADKHEFYGEWVSGYASDSYHEDNEVLTELMNRLSEDYSEKRKEHLVEIFTACSRYEAAFWDIAWEMRQ